MNATQGMRLVRALKRKPHTYLDMLMLGISTSPQKRVVEALRRLPDHQLVKGMRGGLVTWKIVAPTRWTA